MCRICHQQTGLGRQIYARQRVRKVYSERLTGCFLHLSHEPFNPEKQF